MYGRESFLNVRAGWAARVAMVLRVPPLDDHPIRKPDDIPRRRAGFYH